MVSLELEIVSKTQIKPSSKTPDHLRCFKLCFLDQLFPTFYTPVILFYPFKDTTQLLPKLKDSLSKTLTIFYPLAGRVKDNVAIDCNDAGISYIEARVNCSMHDFLMDPTSELQGHLLPSKKLDRDHIIEMIQVQVTVFNCGGIAIGGCFCHKIMDAASISCFLNNWAAIATSSCDRMICPDLITASSLFPPMNHISSPSNEELNPVHASSCVLKTFVFSSSAISALKARATSEVVPNPTRVEVVSAFIWKQVMASLGKTSSILDHRIRMSSKLAFSVNIRTRITPPLAKGCVGNLIAFTFANCKSTEEGEELPDLVGIVHETISQVNGDVLKKIHSLEIFETIFEIIHDFFNNKRTTYLCTSWCKIGITEVDFGWGKPIWIGLLGLKPISELRNTFMLIDTIHSDGIEAQLVLNEEEMTILEHDEEFLAFATPVHGINSQYLT